MTRDAETLDNSLLFGFPGGPDGTVFNQVEIGIDARAEVVNMIEIDVSMAGGLLEAKKIADLAETYYIPVATHNVAGPIATVASANLAASVREFLGHEAFILDPINQAGRGINGDPDVLGYDKELVKDGYIQLSDRPGFGIELNEELIKGKYLVEGEDWWD